MLEASRISTIKNNINGESAAMSNIFSVLGDKNRFLIMKLLVTQGEMCVSDIASVLEISVSAVSQHLRILEMSRMVECERMGQMMCYKPKTDDPSVKKVINLI